MSKEYREISFLLKTYKVVKTPDFFFRPIFMIRMKRKKVSRIKTDNQSEITVRDWIISAIDAILKNRKELNEATKQLEAQRGY